MVVHIFDYKEFQVLLPKLYLNFISELIEFI